MSKSLGNIVSPDDVVAEYGADAVRIRANPSAAALTVSASIQAILRLVQDVQVMLRNVKLLTGKTGVAGYLCHSANRYALAATTASSAPFSLTF